MSDQDDLSTPPATADSIEALLARAVATPAVVPPGSRIADRYEVERVLGAGGMGTVYLARDPKLDRRVAIKLHRSVADAAHLRDEAVAMARLAHPNVVTVFEVGERDGHPFVVMEYVAGETLRARVARATRREILRLVHAAGEGLVAAHAAGLVHRDVKPDNVLVGEDGRARIGDFGLARVGRAEGVAGTPAYMAPEQRAGGVVDERSDQYALAVLAWEALAGALPPGGALPNRLRRVLERALADEPAARWPSVRAFLDALARAERRPRQVALAAAALVLAGTVAVWAWPAGDPADACDGVASALDRVLPARDTAALVAAVRTSALPHAAERGQLIEQGFAVHRREHAQHARHACRARVTKAWSPELVAASEECLAFHALTARELARAMAGAVTPETITDAVQLAGRLPAIAECTDPRILAAWEPIVPDAARRDEAIAARARLAVAALHVELGQLASARAIVDAIATDPARDIPAIALRHDLVAGTLALASHELAAAERELEAAYFAARARDDGEVMLLAVGELVRATAMVRRDREAAARWIENGLADAARGHVRFPHAAAFVRLAIAAAAAKAGDAELALQRLAEAEAGLNARGSSLLHAAMLLVRAEVFAELGRWSETIAIYDALVLIFQRALGEHHPLVAEIHADRASVLLEAGRQDAAIAALRQAMAIADGDVAAVGPSLAATETSIGATLIAAGDPRAETYLERARTRLVATFGDRHPDVAMIDTNLALLYLDRGDKERALATLRHAIAAQEAVIGDHVELAAALYNLAVVERETGMLDAARATAERCAAIYARRQAGSPRHVYALAHRAMIDNLAGRPSTALAHAEAALAAVRDASEPMGPAWARLELGRALLALRRDPARARRVLAEARAAYLLANLPDRVGEIDALLATVR